MNRILVKNDDITIGEPLPWTLYDQQHGLLLGQGSIVSNDEHRDKLLALGACYELLMKAPESRDSSLNGNVNSEHHMVGSSSFTFDDMGLKVGDRLQLQPPAHLNRGRFLVKVIGFLKDRTLLITAPTAGGARLQLLEGEAIVMRAFSGQNAFGFACTIERVCKLPYEYLHLSFPDVIEGVVIRKFPRVKTHILTAVQKVNSQNTEENISTFITNISATGAALDARQALGSEGDMLNLAFHVSLHNIDAFLSINGVIRTVISGHATDVSEPDIVRHGIEFQNMQPNDTIILKSLIYQQLNENPHQQVQ